MRVDLIVERVEQKADDEQARVVLELMEEVLIRRFRDRSREEIRKMFDLADIRQTRVWQEARDEGRAEGVELQKAIMVRQLIANGKTIKEIAQFFDLTQVEIRRLSKK